MLQVHLTSIKNSTQYMRPSKHFKSYACGNYRVAGSGVCLGFIMISVYGVLINTLYMYCRCAVGVEIPSLSYVVK